VLGHRGARHNLPENTLRAFEGALAEGADGIEFDVRMSGDGELFISHDDALHVLGASRPVSLSRLSSAQLRALRLQSGEPIPTLDDVLDFHRSTNCLINVELKGNLPAPLYLARKAMEKLRLHGTPGVLVSSFHLLQVLAVSRGLPNVPTGYLFEEKQCFFSKFSPHRWLGARAVHPEASLATPEAVHRYVSQSTLVNVWTVNDPALATALSERGVDALITDRPAAILAELSGSD
jgi:glycerophosphoryl diester phosphodiesterase